MGTLELKIMPALVKAEPFVKWAGGKRQLINQIIRHLPRTWTDRFPRNYVEPMVGGGALFFYIASRYELARKVICDINKDLVLAYKTIQINPEALIDELLSFQSRYYTSTPSQREELFYSERNEFNDASTGFDYSYYSSSWVTRTSQLIFLNRTCFNGLYRVNAKGLFNVPFGGYADPAICKADNINKASKVLHDAIVINGDFEDCYGYVDSDSLVYFDPPYRPISKTSSFTSYSSSFDDNEQLRLAKFFNKLSGTRARLILSNSDPHNTNPLDDFFDCLYARYRIWRLPASRMINSVASKRGPVTELLIYNYDENGDVTKLDSE